MFWTKPLAEGRSGQIARRMRLAHRVRARLVPGVASRHATEMAIRAANMRAMSPWHEMRLHAETSLKLKTSTSMPNTIFGFCVGWSRARSSPLTTFVHWRLSDHPTCPAHAGRYGPSRLWSYVCRVSAGRNSRSSTSFDRQLAPRCVRLKPSKGQFMSERKSRNLSAPARDPKYEGRKNAKRKPTAAAKKKSIWWRVRADVSRHGGAVCRRQHFIAGPT
jgi:hypothetical protein